MDSVLKQHEARQAQRVIYEFDLPEEIQQLDDRFIKKSVGLRKLEMREEIEALERSGGSSAKAGYYMTMLALVEVDGHPIDRTNAEEETIFNGTDPSIRSLVVDAYTDISGTTDKVTKAFLKSRRTKVTGG